MNMLLILSGDRWVLKVAMGLFWIASLLQPTTFFLWSDLVRAIARRRLSNSNPLVASGLCTNPRTPPQSTKHDVGTRKGARPPTRLQTTDSPTLRPSCNPRLRIPPPEERRLLHDSIYSKASPATDVRPPRRPR